MPFGVSEVVTTESFRRGQDFDRWHETARRNRYQNITMFILSEYFHGPNDALILSEELNASRRTVIEKLNLFHVPLKKTDIAKPRKKRKTVRWVFECGCEYVGPRYKSRECKKHQAPFAYEIVICEGCGEAVKVGPKGFGVKYCPECKKKRVAVQRKESKERIARRDTSMKASRAKEPVELCTRCKKEPIGEGLRFLCRGCYKKG